MPNGTYGGVRGKETKIGQKIFVSRPTRFIAIGVLPEFDNYDCRTGLSQNLYFYPSELYPEKLLEPLFVVSCH